MTFKLLSFLIALFSICLSYPVVAQDEAEKRAEENQQKVEQEIEKETPITKWIDSENEVLNSLSKESQQVFFILRNKHSMMRSVDIVKRDVKNAVQKCSDKNVDMAEDMQTRYKKWSESIDPILNDAQEFLELELKEQQFFDVADYRRVVKMNDDAYEFSESKVKKQIVTTPEACQNLLESMDRTEEQLIDILQDALLPEEVVRERVEQMNKAKKK
jgi:hypothetical protein